MGMIDNLSSGQVKDIFRRLRALENGAPMNNAAIGRGGIEVYDGGVIRITNGGLSVTGTASITGTLQADGTVAFTGTFTQSGPTTFTGDTKLNGPTHINGTTDITGNTTVTGDFNVNGPMKTTGTLSVEGVTTLKNDLNVTTGKIKAGGLTLDPAASGGSVVFSGGGGLQGTAGVTAVKGAGNAGFITDTNASMFSASSQIDTTPTSARMLAGGKSVEVTSAGAKVTGVLTLSGYPSTTAVANMHITSGGVVYVSTSAARFKVDAQPMDLPDSLLAVPVKDWIDKGEQERGEATRRTPGIIAEEVRDGGGEQFVTYNDDGEIQGVMYDRLALARTEVLARKLDAALARIAELEA